MDHVSVLVRGIGDIGSAVAHRLSEAGHRVAIHDVPAPAAARRGMAFTDALFDGPVVLEGVTCRRIERLSELAEVAGGSGELLPRGERWIPATTLPLEEVIDCLRPAVLVDARMRKRAVPEPQRHLAPLTIGLGPNFVAGETTDLVVETSWGERLGTILTEGSPAPLAGEPRTYGGHARDRFVYAPGRGMFRTTAAIGERVRAGQVVATLDGAALAAPLDGILRGLTHDGVVVEQGTKCIEVDPRGDIRHVTGIGERPGAIGDAVVRAIRAFRSVRVPGDQR
jgi:xanthine dehydrogenase accessory factor